jgi:predicted RNA-binding protein Jag
MALLAQALFMEQKNAKIMKQYIALAIGSTGVNMDALERLATAMMLLFQTL